MNTTSDEIRFTELYQRHYSDVDAFVRRRLHTDQVRDVVSEVFLITWRRLSDVPDVHPLPWLYGVARNTLSNTYRSEQRRRVLTDLLRSQPLYAVADHADSVAGQLDVAAAFEQLSDIDQEVLRLALWERLIAKDAAAVLGCTTATFQVKLHRARRRLRKILEKTPNSPSDNVDHRPIRKEKRGGIDA